MRYLKSVIALLLCFTLLLPLASCSGSGSTVIASYKDTTIDSSLFSYMLSSQKAYVEYLFSVYYGTQDFDALWASEASTDEAGNKITFGDQMFSTVVDSLKRLVVIKQLAKEYDLTITDESHLGDISDFIEGDMSIAGGKAFLEIALAKYGATIEDEEDYLYSQGLTSVVMEHLFGQNGTMKVPDTQVREEFDKSYYKIDTHYFGYTETNSSGQTTNRIDSDVTDEEIKTYFNENYLKAEQVLFYFYDLNDTTGQTKIDEAKIEEKRKTARELFEKIKNGEISFEDAKKDYNEDPGMFTGKGGDVLGKGTFNEKFKDFEDKLFSLEVGGIELIETDVGMHIVRRIELKEEDYTDVNKNKALITLTQERIKANAEETFTKIQAGQLDITGESKYGQYAQSVLVTEDDTEKELIDIIKGLKEGEVAKYESDEGIVIVRRNAITDDDYKSKYSTVYNKLSQNAFEEYLESFYPQVVLNEEEIKKYTFASVESLTIEAFDKDVLSK